MQADSRDTKFDPWCRPFSTPAKDLAAEITRELVNYEGLKGLRKRARKPADQATFETCVSAVVANLVHQELTTPQIPVFLSLSNKWLGKDWRYRSPTDTQMLPAILEHLASPELRWIEFTKGIWATGNLGYRSTIAPTSRLRERIQKRGLGLEDLTREAGEEIILLKSGKDDFWDTSDKVDYIDTPETEAHRKEVDQINRYLAAADLDFDDAAAPGRVIDIGDRYMHRLFIRSLSEHGRLYGGFWMNMSAATRMEGIIIQGEPSATLDFGQMGIRLLYGMAKTQPPSGDLYAIPGLEQHRAGVKKLMAALLFTDSPLKRYPKDIASMMPEGLRVHEAIAMVAGHHPSLVPYFSQGIGHRVTYMESEILIDILMKLMDMDVTALPIHDAILVPASKADIAKAVMLDVFHSHTGIDGVVDVKGGSWTIGYKGTPRGFSIEGVISPPALSSV